MAAVANRRPDTEAALHLHIPDGCVTTSDLQHERDQEREFAQLFKSTNNSNALLLYHADHCDANIFHQLNWNLFAFHSMITSDILRQRIKRRAAFVADTNRPFHILLILPWRDEHLASRQWVAQMYRAYPFHAVFDFAVNLTIYYSVPSDIHKLVEKYQINGCIKIEAGLSMLNFGADNDWNVTHQPKRWWLYQWAQALKRKHEIPTHLEWSPPKIRVLCLQRPHRNRFLLDAETAQDLCLALSQHLNASRYTVKSVQFNMTYPTALDQARFVAESHIIIAAHGAALTNLVFMSDAAVAIEAKIRVLCLQRPHRNRFLLDAETAQDLCLALSQHLNASRYTVKSVQFNMTYPTALDQARLVAESHIIIAAHGAALTNLVFMSDAAVAIEVGFRFGWTHSCAQHRLLRNMSNDKLLARWRNASYGNGERFYPKADFFALVHTLSFSNDNGSAPNLRYLQVDAVRYGNEFNSRNCIHKEYMYVNTTFLVGEIERAYSDRDYDFERQLMLHHNLFEREGMLLPGTGRETVPPTTTLPIVTTLVDVFFSSESDSLHLEW
eukprot:CAMPEP_0197075230 /NCGR_PEP_ID=MMETSP1384-20130603/211506_1 /TAXON_ID=29189 /ORGANISM="Ammonia sp." /LENGTH=554 /DNA_ID=CAMNT_0042514073 /DNA_START=67 /DNA_END=1728 /DNA_ORIENTATION=-